MTTLTDAYTGGRQLSWGHFGSGLMSYSGSNTLELGLGGGSSGTDYLERTTSVATDQHSAEEEFWFTESTGIPFAYIGPAVRMHTSAMSGYFAGIVAADGTVFINKYNAGTPEDGPSTSVTAWAENVHHTMRLTARGTTTTHLTLEVDDVVVLTWEDSTSPFYGASYLGTGHIGYYNPGTDFLWFLDNFTGQDVTGPLPGATFHWDARVGVTGSPNVTAVADQSGNGVNLNNVVGTPKTGTRTINGLNALDFGTGSADEVLYRIATLIAEPYTFYAVVKSDVTSATHKEFFNGSGVHFGMTGTAWTAGGGDLSGGTVDTNPHVITAICNGASAKLRLDGTQIDTGTTGPVTITNPCWGGDGDTAVWDGLVAVFLCYPEAHSATELAIIEADLAATWMAAGADPADLDVVITGDDAALSWTASTTPGVTAYDVFRRSPPTSVAFVPGTDAPIARVTGATTYADNNLANGTYEWQVFGVVP